MKKVLVTIIVVLFMISAFIRWYDYIRLKNIIKDIFNYDVDSYITLIDSKEICFTDSYEKYIFKIKNTKKVNCKFLKHEKTYLSSDKSYCTQGFVDSKDRDIIVTIKDDTLTIKIFIE